MNETGPNCRMYDNELSECLFSTIPLYPFSAAPCWFKKPRCPHSGLAGPLGRLGPHQPFLPLEGALVHQGAPASWCSSWKFSHKAPVPACLTLAVLERT